MSSVFVETYQGFASNVRKRVNSRIFGRCGYTVVDYILITNLMHQLLFIHQIMFFSTRFEPQVLIFRRIQM